MVVTYHPNFDVIIHIIRVHWHTIEKHPQLSKIFPESTQKTKKFEKSIGDIYLISYTLQGLW